MPKLPTRRSLLIRSFILGASLVFRGSVLGQATQSDPGRGEAKPVVKRDEVKIDRPHLEVAVGDVGVKIQPKGCLAVAISPDGSRVVAGGQGVLMIWDASDGHALNVIDRGHEFPINAVAFSRDGRWIASSGPARSVTIQGVGSFTYRYEGGIINLWEASSGNRLTTIDPIGCPDELKFASNGDLVASASTLLSVWEAGGSRPRPLQDMRRRDPSGSGDNQLTASSSFSDRGDRFAVHFAGWSDVYLRQATEAKATKLPYGDRTGATTVAVSPDGGKVAVINFQQSLTVWDFATMALEREVPPPVYPEKIDRPTLLAFDPSGKSIISGDEEGIVRVWEAGGDHPSRTIVGPRVPVRAFAFTDRGIRVVSGGWSRLDGNNLGDSNLSFWTIPPQQKP